MSILREYFPVVGILPAAMDFTTTNHNTIYTAAGDEIVNPIVMAVRKLTKRMAAKTYRLCLLK